MFKKSLDELKLLVYRAYVLTIGRKKNMSPYQEQLAKMRATKDYRKIYGLLLLFVWISVCYMVYLTWWGTDGWIPKVMGAPGAGFVVAVAISKFTAS